MRQISLFCKLFILEADFESLLKKVDLFFRSWIEPLLSTSVIINGIYLLIIESSAGSSQFELVFHVEATKINPNLNLIPSYKISVFEIHLRKNPFYNSFKGESRWLMDTTGNVRHKISKTQRVINPFSKNLALTRTSQRPLAVTDLEIFELWSQARQRWDSLRTWELWC